MRNFTIVVAVDAKGGIGLNGDLPWHLPGDMKHFVEVTTGQGDNAVIMGRTTWDSIPKKFRPLKGRRNIVLTRNPTLKLPKGVEVAPGFEAALVTAQDAAGITVIGGASVYRQALTHPGCRAVELTRLAASFDCDVFFDGPGSDFALQTRSEPQSDDGVSYHYERWVRRAR